MKFLYFFYFLGLTVTLSQALDADYLGCWKDTPTRDLNNASKKNDPNLTIDACLTFCALANTYYAAAEAGRQCFCGDTYGKFGRLDEKKCDTPCKKNSSQICGGKFAMSVYNITKLVPCRYTDLKCGEGAVCVNRNAQPVCECPIGKQGDPYERCVDLPMSCGCWGDPHCHTFDKNNFDFMGRCIYDMITTECFNKTLPKGLVPFKVRVKQEKIDGVPNADKVAFVRYVEIQVQDTKYRLGTDSKVQAVTESSIRFFVNNIQRNPPYQDPKLGVQVYMSGGLLMFSSQFGLTVTWGGKSKVEILLSSSYRDLVCGLCGDGDNDPRNDFVDRKNQLVNLPTALSSRFTKHFNWGNKWRIDASEYPLSDTSVDLDGSFCASDPKPCSSSNNCTVPSFECKNFALYESSDDWCGIIGNPNGPWAECIDLMNPTQLAGAISGCVFDMCALEGDETQNAFRCNAYATLTSQCYDVFNFNKQKFIINWREAVKCPISCKDNQVYDVRAQCPRSCLFPQGNPDCGVLDPIEGCYCKPGFVLDPNNNCIEESQCGCKLPDGSTSLSVGEKLVSLDCRTIYSCNGPLQNVTSEYITPCSTDGYCVVENNVPKCLCNEGFQGNGYLCQPIPPPVLNCTKTICGVGAVCNVIRGVETCSCQTGTLGNPLEKCIQGPMSCGCWGDPHCHTFDKSSFDFMGRCTYDMISTDCFNKTLPKGLVPFKVRVKQEKRENVPNANSVSFIRYIEVIVYGNTYRLETVSPTELITKGMERLYVNGALKKPPYQCKKSGISLYISGGYLRFTSNFGLSITWGGKSQAEILLSSSYSGVVCGLCGNGDGISTNDFVNRNNDKVPLVGNRFTKYFNWGSSWKIPANEFPPNDNSIDLNNQKCVDEFEPCYDTESCPPSPRCENEDLYENNDNWCAIMKNPTGPWAACIELMDSSQLEGLISGCVFDMCALEGDEKQNELRCGAFETFTSQCYDIFNTNNIGTVIEWRNFTNCPIDCGPNAVYDVRAQCPRSCLFPQGNPDCGVLDPIEGCYCKPGFILDSNQNCIEESKCGCILENDDEIFILEIGEKIINSDCTVVYNCASSETGPTLTAVNLTPCSENAICLIDENNEPSCMCELGFAGDGYTCQLVPPLLPDEPANLNFTLLTTEIPKLPLCDGYYQFCTIYGDPHYITTSGFRFNMNDNCTYLIATDECDASVPKSYEIFASHQFRNNQTDISYFKTVTIKSGPFKFEINDELTLDGKTLQLPYVSADGLIEVKKQGSFIEMRTLGFLLKYFPGEYLKFYPCSAKQKAFCGLCALDNESEIYEYWNTDINCDQRKATVV